MQFFSELKTWRGNYGSENTFKEASWRFFKVYSPLKELSHKQQTPQPTVFFFVTEYRIFCVRCAFQKIFRTTVQLTYCPMDILATKNNLVSYLWNLLVN